MINIMINVNPPHRPDSSSGLTRGSLGHEIPDQVRDVWAKSGGPWREDEEGIVAAGHDGGERQPKGGADGGRAASRLFTGLGSISTFGVGGRTKQVFDLQPRRGNRPQAPRHRRAAPTARRLGEAWCIAQSCFGFGLDKVLPNDRRIAAPRPVDGARGYRSYVSAKDSSRTFAAVKMNGRNAGRSRRSRRRPSSAPGMAIRGQF